jgi:hypothetical protein
MGSTEQFLDDDEVSPVVAEALETLEGRKLLRVFAAHDALELVFEGEENNLLVLEGSGDIALGSIDSAAAMEHFGAEES